MPILRSQAAVGRQLAVLAHPARKGRWRDLVAVTGFQFGGGRGKGIAKVIKRDAVHNDAKRIGFVAQRRRRRSEHAPAKFALPELDDLKLFVARAFANEPRATAVRAVCGRFDGVRNTVDVCK